MGFEIVVEADLIRCRFCGAVTQGDLTDLAATADDIERNRDHVPDRIIDMTSVTDLQVGYPDVKALAEHRRALRFPNAFKAAIVVRTPAQIGVASMFRTLNDNPQITVEIFQDEPSALAWLRA